MNKPVSALVSGLFALGLMVVDISPQSDFVAGFVPEAAAFVGRPATPLSFAGVARRTTRRAVVVTSTATAATAAEAAATPPPPSGAVPTGTVVTTLPTGCSVSTIGGVEYHQCAGVYYRAAFQGSNLVYVTTQP